MPRIIAHIDLDAFFASIEERDKPRLKGKPIVVGADPQGGKGRGVVSTANYKAREYGICSALPIMTAWRYSEAARAKGLPPAVFLGTDMEKYSMESRRIMAIVREIVGDRAVVEQASVDEAFVDLSFTDSYERAEKIARELKAAIKNKTGLTASIGVGPNKLIAKIASDREKPDGLTIVREENAEKFLEPLSLRTIPGIGPKTEEQFKKLGVRIVRDAKKFSREELVAMTGKWGYALYEKLRGWDDAPLVTEWIAKSIGRHETFDKDAPVSDRVTDRKFLESTLTALAKDVYENFLTDVRRGNFKSFKRITLTVRFADFTTVTRSVTLPERVVAGPQALKTLEFQGLRLFMPFMDRQENPQRKSIRLLGIRVEKLE